MIVNVLPTLSAKIQKIKTESLGLKLKNPVSLNFYTNITATFQICINFMLQHCVSQNKTQPEIFTIKTSPSLPPPPTVLPLRGRFLPNT